MTSVRNLVRSGWTPVVVDLKQKRKFDITHRDLVVWAEDVCADAVGHTLIKHKYLPELSSFAFKSPGDATLFALKWK